MDSGSGPAEATKTPGAGLCYGTRFSVNGKWRHGWGLIMQGDAAILVGRERGYRVLPFPPNRAPISLWMPCVFPKGSQHKAEAEAYINFL